MAKATNSFVTGKMNKDRDDRLLQANEYRNAMNAQVSRSEGANVGALENVLGNSLISDFRALTLANDIVSIGYCSDEINNRVFIFLTNNTSSSLDYVMQKNYIVVYSTLTNTPTILVQGRFLNFSTKFPITGVNILEDLLYFTDNRNQPRVINVTLANQDSNVINPTYYEIEEQISVAKYNPYQSIQLYKESSITDEYETTMYDVVSLYYPNGGYGDLNADVIAGPNPLLIKKEGFEGDICIGATVGVRNKSTGVISDIGRTVSSSVSSAAYWTVAVAGGNLPAISASTEEIVFSFNQYYNPDYNGDKDYLRDRFVRFAYRYKFIDGEYSIMSPFTQECFIPKQDGYFMYKVNQADASGAFSVPDSPPLDIQDEEDTYRSTVVEFMENKVNKIILRIPMPYTSALMETTLKVTEIDILFKESDSNTINVIENVSITRVQAKTPTGNMYEYEYQSTKPYKVLPSSETTRTYDKVPVRALSQEVISNRIVYGNFINKHTPPATIDYNVAVSAKSSFDLGTATATTNGVTNAAVETININTLAAGLSIQNGYVVTGSASIPANTVIVSFTSTTVVISNETTGTIPDATTLTFQASSNVRYTTSEIEYPNSSLKQNRNYQVGIVLSDKYGRSSTVILSDSDNSVAFNDNQYVGSTVFSDYLAAGINATTFPGNSLKVLFNNPIPGGSTGIYNGDKTSVDYNPLGWYSYKIVVKQTEQEYYNVYLPGIMAAYPNDPLKELGKTSHAVLIADNINKVPRDLTEVGPEQKQFRSSINLHGRVENLASTVANLNNIQYYPGLTSPIVSVIGTDRDLFDGIPTENYVGSAEFYNVVSNPLIARINTPSKQIGVTAVITTATVGSTTLAGLDTLGLTTATISPTPFAAAIVSGQTVTGNGIVDGTIVVSVSNSGGFRKIVLNKNTEGTSIGDVLTFSPTQINSNNWITMPQLAVMETDGVESNLDIFWETTSEGLISELNQAVLGGTADAVSIFGFDTDNFTEALGVGAGANLMSTNFVIKNQFGNTITYTSQTPDQVILTSVEDYNGDDVSSSFTLITDTVNNSYNIQLDDYLYFSNQNATKQTYSFTFEINYSSGAGEPIIQSLITQQPVSLQNVVPNITTTVNDITYIPGTSGGGNGTITSIDSVNGAFASVAQPPANVAWRDLFWTVTNVKNTDAQAANFGVQYAGTTVLVDQSKVNKFWNARLFFSGGSVPVGMIDGTYTCTAVVTDAGGLSDTVTFNLIIDRIPCYTYKYTYTNSGSTISLDYNNCNTNQSNNVTFTDTDPGTASGALYICARTGPVTDGTGGLATLFTQLALNSSDPGNVCPTS
jgi:hypothetical protein